MSAPSVYAAINAITAELGQHGIAKTHVNAIEDYKYRSIDDLLQNLSPLLCKHSLCVLPCVLEKEHAEREDDQRRLFIHTWLKVRFALVSVNDGSTHQVEAYGEAIDASDKATAKAMSSAYKTAMIQTFCIPCRGLDDADAASNRVRTRTHDPAPLQGWDQWCEDLTDIVRVCESDAAISIVQDRYRDQLCALARERSDLYAEVGAAFAERRRELKERTNKAPRTRGRRARHQEAVDAT